MIWSAHFSPDILFGRKLYDMTSYSFERELQDQIYVLKQAAVMSGRDMFEFHLRHYQIMTLFKRLDHSVPRGEDPVRVWLS